MTPGVDSMKMVTRRMLRVHSGETVGSSMSVSLRCSIDRVASLATKEPAGAILIPTPQHEHRATSGKHHSTNTGVRSHCTSKSEYT